MNTGIFFANHDNGQEFLYNTKNTVLGTLDNGDVKSPKFNIFKLVFYRTYGLLSMIEILLCKEKIDFDILECIYSLDTVNLKLEFSDLKKDLCLNAFVGGGCDDGDFLHISFSVADICKNTFDEIDGELLTTGMKQ